MFLPSKKEFLKLAKKGNLIPVYREIIGDVETPPSAYNKIEGKYSFLLESVEGGEKIGRYSFLGSDPIFIFESKGNKIKIIKDGKTEHLMGNPFLYLKELLKQFKVAAPADFKIFHGGLVGYVGYDNVRFIEELPEGKKDDLNLPDIQLMLTGELLAFDRLKHKIMVISNAFVGGDPSKAYDNACKRIDSIIKKLEKPITLKEIDPDDPKNKISFSSNITRSNFENIVKKAKEYIRAGDIIQTVLSQRFKTVFSKNTFSVYRALRTLNPSPYMYYLKFNDLKLIGSSPEVMVRLDKGVATLRPIAGTRPRGKNETEDIKLQKQLLSSEKEKAEHLMLVDLGRNDLGRVCNFGSVKATELMTVEKYSHVMHIVSNITGKLKKGKDAVDLFTACFPAGTVSGAPKVRAMEIINELENVSRGPYAGAVGYFGFDGGLNTCITIRTIIISKNKAYIQAGAGIVADSAPKKEYEETVNKARALFKALSMVDK